VLQLCTFRYPRNSLKAETGPAKSVRHFLRLLQDLRFNSPGTWSASVAIPSLCYAVVATYNFRGSQLVPSRGLTEPPRHEVQYGCDKLLR
jgi:hypothetical protein